MERAALASNATVHIAVGCLMLGYLLFADGVKGGQSIGKRIFHSSVVDAAKRSLPARWGSRWCAIPRCCSCTSWTGASSSAARRQRLGDRLAGTIVITTVVAPPRAAVPETEGPPLSEDEVARTRQVYAGLSMSRLEELRESPEGLRPGAAKLVSEELEKRERAGQMPESQA